MAPIRVLQVMPAMDAGGMETFVMNVYRTIAREKVATHMQELGVDALITAKPDMVQDLLAGTYDAQSFAQAYEKAWNEGF